MNKSVYCQPGEICLSIAFFGKLIAPRKLLSVEKPEALQARNITPSSVWRNSTGVEEGGAWRSSLRGWERAFVDQTNIGTASKDEKGRLSIKSTSEPLQRTRKGVCRTDHHRNCYKGRERTFVIRPTSELPQLQDMGKFWDTGLSAYRLFRARRYHLELKWTDIFYRDLFIRKKERKPTYLISVSCPKRTCF